MYSPLTTRFLQQIRQSGRTKTVVDLYFNGELAATDIPISGGSLRVDRGSDVRRSGSLQIADPSLVPAIKGDILLPYGTEILIRSGVVYTDGTEELIPMGVFGLEQTQWDEGIDLPEIEFFDRAKVMSRFQRTTTRDVSGMYAKALIQQLVPGPFATLSSAPAVNIDTTLVDAKLPGGTTYDSNYWDVLTMAAEAINAEIYFDVNGDFTAVPVPYIDQSTPIASADWTVDVGDTGVLVSARRGFSRSDTYSSVMVRGGTKSNNQQATAEVFDHNPASPTYYLGPFGRARKLVENSALITDAQCMAVAQAELRKVTGLAKSVSFTSLRNPALEVGDIILFTFFDAEQELHMLDSFTYDFASGEMSAETRAQVVNL